MLQRLFLLVFIFSLGCAASARGEGPLHKEWGIPLERGINLGNMLEAPVEGEWGEKIKASYFDLIKQAGFDFVRIPVCWSAHTSPKSPYQIEANFAQRVDWVIRTALEKKLFVIVNVHHFDELMADPAGQKARFLAIWQQIAERYKNYPPSLFFELLNEPCKQMTADQWNSLLVETLAVVRPTNPKRIVVVGPAEYNNISQLPNLRLPANDRHILATVHFYEPFNFTHQGASWVGRENKVGVQWRSSPAEQADVLKYLTTAQQWAKQNNRPLFIGEYGAYEAADATSRVQWTHFVTQQALRCGLPVAYWEFCSSFGIYDPKKEEWRKELLQSVIEE